MTQRTIGYGSLLWCNYVGITSAGAKALNLHNNNNNNKRDLTIGSNSETNGLTRGSGIDPQ